MKFLNSTPKIMKDKLVPSFSRILHIWRLESKYLQSLFLRLYSLMLVATLMAQVGHTDQSNCWSPYCFPTLAPLKSNSSDIITMSKTVGKVADFISSANLQTFFGFCPLLLLVWQLCSCAVSPQRGLVEPAPFLRPLKQSCLHIRILWTILHGGRNCDFMQSR